MVTDDAVDATILAVNVLVLVWFAVSYVKNPSGRNSALAGFGGLLPGLLFHAYITLDFYLNDRSGSDAFAYYAQWAMAGWVGPFFGVLGFVLRRFVFKQFGAAASFLLGLLPCSVFYLWVSNW